MTFTSLDSITRRWLLESGYPIHYYMDGLFQSATCLRELNFDVLKIINSQGLVPDDTGSIFLPDDFAEDITVCIPFGQVLKPLPKQDWITPLRLHDANTGLFVPYQGNTTVPRETFCGYPLVGSVWFWNVNDFGEPTGRVFGARGGTSSGYQVFKEQRRIQLSEDLIGINVVLIYVGDGSSIDNASQIDPQAWMTINSFIEWKRSPNRNNKDSAEGRNFYNERRKLVARLDDLTPTDIRNIAHNAYSATIKN